MLTVKTERLIRRSVQNEVNQQESEQEEVDGMNEEADSTGTLAHTYKSG